MEAPEEHPDLSHADTLTRAERRQRRQEAARQRMPEHGRGMGVMVRNAVLRRIKNDASAEKRG